jgi:hypothetical protein
MRARSPDAWANPPCKSLSTKASTMRCPRKMEYILWNRAYLRSLVYLVKIGGGPTVQTLHLWSGNTLAYTTLMNKTTNHRGDQAISELSAQETLIVPSKSRRIILTLVSKTPIRSAFRKVRNPKLNRHSSNAPKASSQTLWMLSLGTQEKDS